MNNDARFLIDLLLRICSPICKYKDDLKISHKETIGSIMISAKCHQADYVKLMGSKCKATGKPCKVLTGLNAILRAAGEKIGKQVELAIDAPESIVREYDAQFRADPNFDRNELMDLVWDICAATLEKEFRINPEDIDQRTTIEIYPDPKEGIPAALSLALNNVMHIWGNARGRKVKIECADVYQES